MDISDPVIELWSSYGHNKSIDVRNKIFQHYSSWIKKISSYQYSKYKADYIDWGDCVQNASIALLESIDRYDISRGVPFEAFAYSRIKGAILNGLADYKKNSYNIYKDMPHLSEFFDVSVNSEEAFEQFIDVVIDIAFAKILDLSSYRFSKMGVDPFDLYIMNSEEKKVLSAVKNLPSELQFIIISHYNHFLTFTQIANELKVSKSRISQLHREALKKLRVIYESI